MILPFILCEWLKPYFNTAEEVICAASDLKNPPQSIIWLEKVISKYADLYKRKNPNFDNKKSYENLKIFGENKNCQTFYDFGSAPTAS